MPLRLRIPTFWLRIALPFLLFVAAGSVALALWIQRAAQRESDAVFAALARTNAEFFRDRRLALSERMAGYISQMLNAHAFVRRGSELLPEPDSELAGQREQLLALRADQGVMRIGGVFEAIAAPVDGEVSLLLARPAARPFAFLLQRETLLVLVAFWLLSIALAWAITRGVVRPLRLLALRLPHIGHDSEATLPGTDRDDEIGQLARAYLVTRAQLAEERARREQAERLAILGRMATGLAHEIHNPLSAIRMHSQLIDCAPPGDVEDAARTSIPVLLGETAKIESLVNQWMFLARPAPPETTRTDLAELVAEVVRAQCAHAAHAEVILENSTAAGLVVAADSRRLSQALSNVVINAIQAMPDGGTLRITGELEEAHARLVFHDTGPGFSSAALDRHSELFFSEKEGGMGIGLNVTAEILKAHGGALTTANSPHGGAIVTLEVPIISTPDSQL